MCLFRGESEGGEVRVDWNVTCMEGMGNESVEQECPKSRVGGGRGRAQGQAW